MTDQNHDGNQDSTTWDGLAKNWENQEGVRLFSENTKTLLLNQFSEDNFSQATILDLGCGTGLLSRLISQHGCKAVVSIDPSKEMLSVLQSRLVDTDNNIRSIQGVLDNDMVLKLLEENYGPFDAVVANSVCSFVPNYDDLLGMIVRVLAPGGIFLQCDWEQQIKPLTNNNADGFHHDMIRRAYKKVGLDVVDIKSAFQIMDMQVIAGVGRKAG